jgi:hypothetical protein
MRSTAGKERFPDYPYSPGNTPDFLISTFPLPDLNEDSKLPVSSHFLSDLLDFG